MELFIVNDVDYTNHILVPSYKVQSNPVTKEWEDATYTKHTDLLRWRVEGSFTIYFDDIQEFHDFLDNLNNSREVDNYIPAVVYDNRTHSQKTSKFNINIAIVNNLPYYQRKQHDGYAVTIEEK